MRLTTTCLLAALVACGGSVTSNTHGNATYAQPAPRGGKPVQPQQKSDDLKVTISIAGQGNFDRVNSALCQLTSGEFSEKAETSGHFNSDGTYVSEFSSESGSTELKSPVCGALKNLKATSITSITVQASVPANDNNCSGYCDAKASTSCSSTDSTCIANTTASCKTQCKGSGKITGHGSLDSSAAGDVNSKLGGSGNVDARVDLVFDGLQ